MTANVLKLDEACSSKIRKSQVITTISDVVRELVDNAVDAEAHSVQILLENYGLKKIEVKDNGRGIAAEDLPNLFKGGYTSKLNDDSHLSCGTQYGFRGEALSAICSFSGVVVTTKQREDSVAKKFSFNKRGQITSEGSVACGNGTVVVVRELFKDYPVRNKHSAEPRNAKNQLKEIEFYLKSLGICNPSVFFGLYHNGNLIWSKPAVKNTEQALTTVLGVGLARNLSKCITAEITLNESAARGQLELFVPQKPVDMKNMGYTSSKWTMIFVNRRQVVVEDFQNLIKRYAVGSTDSPTQQEQRKFPLAVFMITVPATEVDFNRDMNKSKMFMTCKDLVFSRLEDMLQSYYDVDLRVLNDFVPLNTTTDTTGDALNISMAESESGEKSSSSEFPRPSMQLVNVCASTPEKRQENISSFLEGLTRVPPADKQPLACTKSTATNHAHSESGARPLVLHDYTISENQSFENRTRSFDLVNRRNDKELFNSSEDSVIELLGFDTRCHHNNNGLNSFLDGTPSGSTGMYDPNSVRATSPFPQDAEFQDSVLYADSFPQCGAILHREPALRTMDESRLSLRPPPHIPLQKRPRQPDSPDKSSPTSQSPPKKIRQVTVDVLQRRDTPRAIHRVSTGSAELRRNVLKIGGFNNSRFEKSMNLETAETTTASEIIGESFDDDDGHVSKTRSYLDTVDSSAVFGLETIISTKTWATIPRDAQENTLANSQSQVVKRLGESGLYIVRIEDLLGVFNAAKFSEDYPELLAESRSAGDDNFGSASYLLGEFTQIIDEIPPDSAQMMFHIIADLEDVINVD